MARTILLLVVAILLMKVLYALHFSVSKRVSPRKILKYYPTLIFSIGAMLTPLAFLYLWSAT